MNEKLIEEAAKAIWATRYPESRPDIAATNWAEITAPGDWTVEALDIFEEARTALAVFEKAHTPTAHEVTTDEREALAQIIADNLTGFPGALPDEDDLEVTDLILAAGFRRSEVPEPSTETLTDVAKRIGASERSSADFDIATSRPLGPEPQGEPSDAQEVIQVASPETWGWEACVVCGSKEVTDRGMVVTVSKTDGVYVSRIGWCDQTQECRDDLRQTQASMLTEDNASAVDAALRAAGEAQ